ncbi:lasso peptide biosynthesis B2 protein [Bacillus suaedae]|uniref:Lasso peptide biosynthesis B2 protein n=1 Tax=Halalkalibacter suaedae TaxID=2822140 RepID=A0A940WZG4_9BACI|nr:lasso peptide biosynthesis B2 protein [Bacillus suaedae]MBP3951501.1 lasso peptide biosynthesis B2 protein [Bacillus suaedae]
MNVLRKLKSFYHLSNDFKGLLLEAYLYLAWARILKLRKFGKVATSLGTQMMETSHLFDPDKRRVMKEVSLAIHMMSTYTFWESQCLVKAITGMKMLEKRGIESTLYLGTAKDEKGEFVAHAWLRSGPFYVSGSEGMEKFTVVATFAKEISAKKIEGEQYG